MTVAHKRNPLKFAYSVNGTNLSEVSAYKYLELWITSDISWSKHIDFVTSTANFKLFFLQRALKLSTASVRLLANQSIVLPTLNYASIIWDRYTKTNLNKAEKIEKGQGLFIIASSERQLRTY